MDLCAAAFEGSLPTILQLLEAGAPVDFPDLSNQRTPLIKAAMKGHTEVVKLLLDHGATASCKDSSGKTALDWAKKQNHESTSEAIRNPQAASRNAGPVSANDVTPDVKAGASEPMRANDILDPKAGMQLFNAALEGSLATVAELLEAGAPIDFPDPSTMRTPLIKAAMKGHSGVVKLLLENGARWSERDASGLTALEWAIKQDHAPTVDALKFGGAVVDHDYADAQQIKLLEERKQGKPQSYKTSFYKQFVHCQK